MIEPSPWSTIWLDPRGTITRISEQNPRYHYYLLMILGGFGQTLNNARGMGELYPFNMLLAVCFISGPIAGYLTLQLGGWVLHFISKKFGGEATLLQIRAALAWAWAPIVYTLPLWGVKYILFRDELFKINMEFAQSQPLLKIIIELLSGIDFIIGIWYLVILFSALSQVNKFSIFKSFGAAIITGTLLSLPVLILYALGGFPGVPGIK